MRIAAFALILATAVAAPLHSQAPAPKGKQPTDRILAWELESFADASLTEVIEKVRPRFFMPDQTRINFGLHAFEYKAIQIKWFGTHTEYDKIDVTIVQFKKK